MSKILVTGGCGYIGSHTILELIKNTDYEIISIDNLMNSSMNSLNSIEKLTKIKIKNYKVDLCDLENTRKVFEDNKDIVGVIHFAALKSVPESVKNPILYYNNNNNSLTNILHCAKEYGVGNVIFSSSCSVYGNVTELPVSEGTPLNKAESPYGNTKQMGEQILEYFSNVNEINLIALRYFNPVGADISGKIGEDPINPPTTLLPIITRTAIGIIPELTVFGDDYETKDGTCVRDYVHVSDIADAHIIALNYLIEGKNKKKYEVFNLGTGDGVTVLDAIEAFEKVSKKKLNYSLGPRREGDVGAIYSDCSKAIKELGWKAKRDINVMMETAWGWQLKLSKLED